MSGIASREKSHSLADRKDDFYATPPEAVRGFLAAESEFLPRRLWEPACGDGAIVLPLRAAGYDVQASDLVDRGCPDSASREDFLMPFAVPMDIGGIVTNPPFKLAAEFVDRSLTIAPYVAMLLRLSFLESATRKDWFQAGPLARVHISSRRMPMMHRDGWEGPQASSAIAFAWFVWDRRHIGRPELHWFDWRAAA
ncbi:hypothetical protein V5F77_05275 [Xanthobacter sp. DSM 24535]|uniref:hypothetical protein n=1 Tax=Roseixanthobacter psychrophilus TaxID=3119917 RepID=UPI00372A3C3B